MTLTVTLEQVAELAERLSLQDQQKLKQQLEERMSRQAYAERVEAFLKMCRENPVRGDGTNTDSAETLREIREERMAQLCPNDV